MLSTRGPAIRWTRGNFGIRAALIITAIAATYAFQWVMESGLGLVPVLMYLGVLAAAVFLQPYRVALMVALILAVAVLELVAPFHLGFLSVLMYGFPFAVILIAGRAAYRRENPWEATRKGTSVLVVALVVAIPVGRFQRVVTDYVPILGDGIDYDCYSSGIPSRAYVQVISVPGSSSDSDGFHWEGCHHRAVAYFDVPHPLFNLADIWEGWGAVETVWKGNANPCPHIQYPSDPDADTEHAGRCEKIGPDLWKVIPYDDPWDVAFVRHENGMTIALAGYVTAQTRLERALMGAHEVTDAERRPRSQWFLLLVK